MNTLVICLIAGLATALVVCSVLLWSFTREQRVKRLRLDGPTEIAEQERLMAGLTLSELSKGNAITLLQDCAFFSEVEQSIRGAKRSVHFETFLWKTGELSARLREVLTQAARRGVQVRMTLDAVGSGGMKAAERHQLAEAGVQVAFFHPRRLRSVSHFNCRDHRKMVVVDGSLAFVGGHCVTDDWVGKDGKVPYRDISARVEGPAVAQLQAAFSENWTETTGKLLVDHNLFPKLEPAGEIASHLVYVDLLNRVSSVKVLHLLAISFARERIIIQNPYLLPDKELKDALCAASKRGVKTRIMIPASQASDNAIVAHAVQHGLRPLLEAGIEIFAYQRTLLHQKVLTVDGYWSAVGSANLDSRSLDINEEASLSIFSRDVSAALEDTFERDLPECVQLDLTAWRSRSMFSKAVDFLAWQVRPQL